MTPITILADGLSGGALLSMKEILNDILHFRATFFIRLLAWFAIIYPIAGIALSIIAIRKQNYTA